jgi:tetratricopeptide (TPR) repeat protein
MAQNAGPLKQLGLARRFHKEAEVAVALDPKRFDAQDALLMFFLKAPGVMGGGKDKAQAKVAEIAKLDPVKGAFAHARLALANHDSAAALADYRRAVALVPNDYEPRITLANALAARNDWVGAEREATEAKRLDSGRAGSYALMAMIEAHRGGWSDLDAVLAESEKNVPGNLNPYYQAARTLLADNRELPRAERYLRHYLSVPPEGGTPAWSAAHWRLGLVLEKQGRKPEAIAELEAAVRARPPYEPASKDLKRLKKAG